MKKKLISVFTALVLALGAAGHTAAAETNYAENEFTSEMMTEFLHEEEKDTFSVACDLLNTLPYGKEVTFSKPFKIPEYRSDGGFATGVGLPWHSALFVDGKLYAMATFSCTNEVQFHGFTYMPYEVTEKIDSGKELSLFLVGAKLNGLWSKYCLFYSIEESGKLSLLDDPLPTCEIDNALYADKMTKAERTAIHSVISEFNVISKDMEKAVTIPFSEVRKLNREIPTDADREYTAANELHDNDVISLEGITGDLWSISGTQEFIVRECGRDGNGEMTYSLALKNAPDSKLNFGGTQKVYFRCAYSWNSPKYMICSAEKPDKVLTVNGGKAKMQKWTGAVEQQWYVHLK